MDKDKKSMLVAYLLWIIGGWFGLHLFYLHRDRHAFVTWMSFGSYFGLGWIRDIWRIPTYVRDYNEDGEYLKELTLRMRKEKKPESGFVRSCGTIIVADILGYLAMGAVPLEYVPEPDYYSKFIFAAIVPAAVAIGVHTVGNIGRVEGRLLPALLGAYLTAPLYIYSANSVFWTSLVSSYFFNKYAKQWRRRVTKRYRFHVRIAALTLAALLYIGLWSSWVYFNCSITDKDDQVVKCRDAAKNFLQSPAWQDFTNTMRDIRVYFQVHGWKGLWREIVESLDPQGEKNALQTLNLTSDASQEAITARYRLLAKTWHPDRHKDESKKIEAQEQFIIIQEAYQILSRIKSDRLVRNQRGRENPIAAG